jgi:hypothetical protein
LRFIVGKLRSTFGRWYSLKEFGVSREGREENRRKKQFPFATFAAFARHIRLAALEED